MTFRTEEKFFVNYQNLDKLLCWIKSRDNEEVYPKRYISSLYFDSETKQLLFDSEEGIVPRKKIRLRTYQKLFNFKKKIYYEIKITSAEGKFKTSKLLENNKIDKLIKKGIYISNYGILYPKLYVSYLRYYFLVEKIRLNIDTNILYSAYQIKGKKNFLIEDSDIVAEIKAPLNVDMNIISNTFPFMKRRFSKYSRGILYTMNQRKNIINSF